MNKQILLKLESANHSNFDDVGGKAANLGEMITSKMPVPTGYVLTTTGYDLFIQENSLQDRISKLLNESNLSDFDDLEKVSKEIKSLINDSEMPEKLLVEWLAKKDYFESKSFAVRSSSTAEDLPGLSFAGQYDTFLNVKGLDNILSYIKKCFASLWNARAISYREQNNIDNFSISHAVVLQELIDSDKSGILFTANPINGRRDQMLINSSFGLGEAVVGGEVNPDQWVIAKNGEIIEETIATKEMQSVRANYGIELVEIEKSKQNIKSLNKSQLMELLELAKTAEEYFGSPQDLEWAYLNNKFYLVQSRPITSLYPMPKKVASKDDLRVLINFNNYSQAMQEPFTPMGESIIESLFASAINYLGHDVKVDDLWWLQSIGGRLFIDFTDLVRTEKSSSKFKNVDAADKDPVTIQAIKQFIERNKSEIIAPEKQFKLRKLINFKVIKLGLGIINQYLYGIRSAEKARNKAINLADTIIRDLENEKSKLKSLSDKLNFFNKHGKTFFLDGFGIVFYVAVSSTYIEKVKKMLENNNLPTNDLKYVERSLPHSPTTEMGMEILQLARYYDELGEKPRANDEKIKEFISKYGHRNLIELDVGIKPWKEDPSYVLDLINTHIDNETYQKGIDSFKEGEVEAEKAIKRIVDSLKSKNKNRSAKKAEKMLLDFRAMFGIREKPKSFVRKFLTIFRDILLEIGDDLYSTGAIDHPEDIFYLKLQDIKRNQDLIDKVKNNKEQYQINLKKKAPRIIASTGESIYAAKTNNKDGSLEGIPVSSGAYEGIARIIHSPKEAYRLKNGEILVTAGTNPTWTPLFLKLGALVMETGGSISHGSVVAREYGLPAVAGLANATSIIKDGQKIRVDGESGLVEILEQGGN